MRRASRETGLGWASALKVLECALCLLEIRTLFFEFGTTDLGALVQTRILDRGCGGNGERFC